MTNPIYTTGQFTGLRTLKDGTLNLSIQCNEESPEKAGLLFSLNNKFIYIGFKEEPFLNEEKELLEKMESSETIGKTPSQRLRAVLFVSYHDNQQGFDSFDQFYIAKMEKFINIIKDKLPNQ